MSGYKRFKISIMKGIIPIWLLSIMFFMSLYGSSYSAVSLNLYQILGEDKGFLAPNGVAADASNNVYVADYLANTVFKLTPPPSINVTAFITIDKPVAIAYYNNKLYVVSASQGGKVYNTSDGSYAGVSFGTGYGDYRDVKKPADVILDISGNIYVADMEDSYIKKYNSSGSFLQVLGGKYPLNCTSALDCGDAYYGNGLFYIVSTLAYDSTTNRLIVGDLGNATPYMTVGAVKQYNKVAKTWTWVKSTKHYGAPKGKIQVYNLSNSTWIRQAVTHGSRSNYGQAYNISGLWLDPTNNHLYIVDSGNKKILIIDNVANDTKAPLWTTRSAQDQQELKENEVAVADSPLQNPINAPTRYTLVQGAYDLSGYFGFFKDVVKAGSYLIVTDKMGKVYYFVVNIN